MRKFAIPVVLVLILVSLQGVKYAGKYTGVIVPDKVTAAVIIEETAMRPKLSANIRQVLSIASKHGVRVVDINVVAADRKTPTVLAPFIKAVDPQKLPQLVLERGSAYVPQSVPASEAELVEAIR